MIKAKPMGMLWMIPAGGQSTLLKAASWTLEALPEGRLGHGMNIYTLLHDAVRGFGGAAARGRTDEAGRRQRLVGIHGIGTCPEWSQRRLTGTDGSDLPLSVPHLSSRFQS